MNNQYNKNVIEHVEKLMVEYKRLSNDELKEEIEYLKSIKGSKIYKNEYKEYLISEIEKIIQ